jgi:short-subunit dehydrogenase
MADVLKRKALMSQESVAVITGASRGLGRSIAIHLSRQGYRLALIARNQKELEQLKHELNKPDDKVQCFRFDLSNFAEIASLVDRIHTSFGSIDVLINNAGVGFYKPLSEHSTDEINAIVNVNLTAPIILSKFVSEIMQQQKAGHIINIGSDLAQKPLANMTPYVASKHGVQGMSQSLLREVKEDGVKVTVINSGIVDTYFHGGVQGEQPSDKSLNPNELAQLVLQVLQQPGYQLIDQITVHPLHQEF